MAGVFDLELHDTPEGDEDVSDDEYFEPDDQVRMPVCWIWSCDVRTITKAESQSLGFYFLTTI